MDSLTIQPSFPKKKTIRKIKILPNSESTTINNNESEYINSFTEKEKKAYLIAKSHLMTSFSLKKSNGYLDFTSKNKSV
jgi:hypothetical protein